MVSEVTNMPRLRSEAEVRDVCEELSILFLKHSSESAEEEGIIL